MEHRPCWALLEKFMSLDSAGQSFTVATNTRMEGVGQIPDIHVYTGDNSVEGAKEAFLKSMEQFANSEHFAELVYQLENHFDLHIVHTAHLAMPG